MRGKTPAYLSKAVLLFWTGIGNDWAFCVDQPRHGSLPAPVMYSSKLEGSPGKALPCKFRLEQGLQIPSGNSPGGYTGPIRRDSKKLFSGARTPHLTASVSSQFFEYNPRPSGEDIFTKVRCSAGKRLQIRVRHGARGSEHSFGLTGQLVRAVSPALLPLQQLRWRGK